MLTSVQPSQLQLCHVSLLEEVLRIAMLNYECEECVCSTVKELLLLTISFLVVIKY